MATCSGDRIQPARGGFAWLVLAGFGVLGAALALGRVPFPPGDSFGYASWARNLAVAGLVGHLVGARGLRWRSSPTGTALVAYLVAAALSVAVNQGSYADVQTLAVGVALFFVARALAAPPGRERILLDWLGAVAVAIVVREIALDPSLLALRESARTRLVTDHPNTLGYAFAVLVPIFLGGAARGRGASRAAFYAVAACLGAAFTFSRAAWIGCALGVATVLAADRAAARSGAGDGRGSGRPGAIAALALGAVLVALAVLEVSSGRGESDQQRLRIVETSLSLFRDHWPFGVGFGTRNLERLFPSRYVELFGASLFLFHSHNLYVDALVGTGVVGAAATAYLVIALLALARRGLRLPEHALPRAEAASFAAAIAVFLLLALADMPFYHGRLTIVVALVLAWIEARTDACEARADDCEARGECVAGARSSPYPRPG